MMKTIKSSSRHPNSGVTLVEVILTAGIMAVVIVGLLQLFAYCAPLSQSSWLMSAAVMEAQSKMEEVMNTDYDDIPATYGGSDAVFDLTIASGKGVIFIDTTNAELLQIKVSVSWQNAQGRIYGEDTNLDGVLDPGEDVNSNGQLDSSVMLTTLLARK